MARSGLVDAYRRTGADLPGGDPRPTHGAEMEGWFWRITDANRGRAVVALCGINRHAAGPWATAALATHPGGVHAAVLGDARASADRFELSVPGGFEADAHHLRVHLGGDELDVRFSELVPWPLRLGAGGIFSVLPWLGQYWHPHALGGRVDGVARVGGERWELDGARLYAEKNWGSGFPDWWWWGEAHDWDDGADACVAFGGGRLRVGPATISVGGCVIRIHDRVIRFAPPTAVVRAEVADGRWCIHARRPGWNLDVEGTSAGTPPQVLPVPLPSERRNIATDLEHLAGSLEVRLRRGRRIVFASASALAGLEIGTTDPARAQRQRAEVGLAPDAG